VASKSPGPVKKRVTTVTQPFIPAALHNKRPLLIHSVVVVVVVVAAAAAVVK
jgi:hypothetical protein